MRIKRKQGGYKIMTDCTHANTSVVNSGNGTTSRIKKSHYDCFMHRTRKCDNCGKNIKTVEIERDKFEKMLSGNVKRDIVQDLIKYLSRLP